MSDHADPAVDAVLAKHLGLSVASIGAATLRAAIRDRAKACGVSPDDYALALDRPGELAALVDAIVVPETWFLRDRKPFENLAAVAKARLRSERRPFRVLSAPCSTGEEPYSVVMAMLELGIPTTDMHVDAVDVSPGLIASAQRGEYRAISFRGNDLGFRDTYFTPIEDPHGDRWRIADSIRAAVRFKTANLVAPDSWLATERPYDAILCRNLLIYLTADARRAVMTRLGSLLVKGGILVVGHAEALEVIDPRFTGINVPSSFTYKLHDPTGPAVRAEQPTVPLRKIVRPTPVAGTPIVPAVGRASVPAEATTVPIPIVRDRVAEAQALADRGEHAAAIALLEDHLHRASTDAPAWALLGTIRQATGDPARAEDCFSRALYCDPNLRPALLQLALLLDARGDAKGAANLRRRADRGRT